MKTLTYIVIFSAIFLLSQGLPSEDIASKKLEKLHEMLSDNSFVNLNSTSFRRYVMGGHRDYSLVLQITSETDAYDCALCRILSPLFVQVSEYFRNQYKENEKKIFFARADIVNLQDILPELSSKVKEIPLTLIVRPNLKKADPFDFITGEQFLPSKLEITSKEFANWVNKHLKINIHIPENLLAKVGPYLLGAFVVFVIVAVNWKFVVKKLKDPLTWFALFMLEYFIIMSGTVYNMIHGNPLFINQRNSIVWMHPNPRSQLGLEGFFNGTLWVGCSMFWILLSDVPKEGRSKKMLWLFLLGFVMVLTLSFKLYKLKSPYYPFFPHL